MTTTQRRDYRRTLLHYEIQLAKARGEWDRAERLTLEAYLNRRRHGGR